VGLTVVIGSKFQLCGGKNHFWSVSRHPTPQQVECTVLACDDNDYGDCDDRMVIVVIVLLTMVIMMVMVLMVSMVVMKVVMVIIIMMISSIKHKLSTWMTLYSRTSSRIHTHKHTHKETYTHPHTHVHIHTHTHVNKQAHTFSLPLDGLLLPDQLTDAHMDLGHLLLRPGTRER
jgi:hypothetical protein